MTKSQQSVTKLRLSRIIRCLLFLGCIKLGLMGLGIFNIHWPFSSSTPQVETPVVQEERVETVDSFPETAPVINEPASMVPPLNQVAEPEELPTGSRAAELAAAAKPQQRNLAGVSSLPAPLLRAEPFNPLADDGTFLTAPLLPEPEPLGQPLAEAGVILPQPEEAKAPASDSIWDMAELKALPFPGLGSVQVAEAASMDMPVPPAAPARSNFAPAEQVNPLNNAGRVLPGAPAFPQNIPGATGTDGAPLPPRQPTIGQSGSYLPPAETPPLQNAPAPNITPNPSNLTPNMKAQELAKQQQDILVLRQQMDQRLKDLQTAEDKMKNMLNEARGIEDQKVKTLIQMYANMKPRTAAQALENMDERVAVRILSGMAPKQSGEILTYTNPVKTAKFTEMLTRLRMGD